MEKRICSVEGCERAFLARGLCRVHYDAQYRQQNLERLRDDDRRRRQDPKRRPRERAYQREWQRRNAMPEWAMQWENRRRAEDLSDLAIVPIVYGRGARLVRGKPKTRQFIAGSCPDCSKPVVVIRGWWHDSIRCPRCTKAKWRGTHVERAKRNGVEWARISSTEIFGRDGHRCQICGRKCRGKFPEPLSATIDHIVPLSKGGPHLEHNLQTACLRCNLQKYDGAANDQLRLAVS